ncbi:MAG: hypothetical protein ABIJ18_01255 [archaeon]
MKRLLLLISLFVLLSFFVVEAKPFCTLDIGLYVKPAIDMPSNILYFEEQLFLEGSWIILDQVYVNSKDCDIENMIFEIDLINPKGLSEHFCTIQIGDGLISVDTSIYDINLSQEIYNFNTSDCEKLLDEPGDYRINVDVNYWESSTRVSHYTTFYRYPSVSSRKNLDSFKVVSSQLYALFLSQEINKKNRIMNIGTTLAAVFITFILTIFATLGVNRFLEIKKQKVDLKVLLVEFKDNRRLIKHITGNEIEIIENNKNCFSEFEYLIVKDIIKNNNLIDINLKLDLFSYYTSLKMFNQILYRIKFVTSSEQIIKKDIETLSKMIIKDELKSKIANYFVGIQKIIDKNNFLLFFRFK